MSKLLIADLTVKSKSFYLKITFKHSTWVEVSDQTGASSTSVTLDVCYKWMTNNKRRQFHHEPEDRFSVHYQRFFTEEGWATFILLFGVQLGWGMMTHIFFIITESLGDSSVPRFDVTGWNLARSHLLSHLLPQCWNYNVLSLNLLTFTSFKKKRPSEKQDTSVIFQRAQLRESFCSDVVSANKLAQTLIQSRRSHPQQSACFLFFFMG